MRNVEQIYDEVHARLTVNSSIEDALLHLRSRGVSKGESVTFLADRVGMDDDLAITTVHQSAAWSDRRAADERLNRSISEIVVEAGKRNPDGSIDLTEWLRSNDDSAPQR